MAEVAVLGGGAWGTALAQMLASDGRDVLLWAREPEVVEDINANHRNTSFLPDSPLAPSIRATGSLADVADVDVILVIAVVFQCCCDCFKMLTCHAYPFN